MSLKICCIWFHVKSWCQKKTKIFTLWFFISVLSIFTSNQALHHHSLTNEMGCAVVLGATITIAILIIVSNTQCRNYRIFLSLRFYVKSILVFLEVEKQRLWFLYFGKFQNFKKCRNSWYQKFRSSKCVKIAFFGSLKLPTSVSRKTWVREKLWNFHTVQQQRLLWAWSSCQRLPWTYPTGRHVPISSYLCQYLSNLYLYYTIFSWR